MVGDNQWDPVVAVNISTELPEGRLILTGQQFAGKGTHGQKRRRLDQVDLFSEKR
tara:strand:- start:39 stop:203 length:165 start_codon:yes stop_codon:yes gene_type:complete